jgi:hypothetical protein
MLALKLTQYTFVLLSFTSEKVPETFLYVPEERVPPVPTTSSRSAL